MKRLGHFILIILVLLFVFDPSRQEMKRFARHITHIIFGTTDTEPSNDRYGNDYIPDQPGADSSEILQGIDSIENNRSN
ncbi:MAG TPA: hypothetical protein VK559_02320 [Ferruginibacter sp.]|nr:hypothetical protein [Ferruginibacter sp.]